MTTPARILCFSPYGSWTVHAQVDAVIASAIRVRGGEARIIGCDGLFENCYVLAHSNNKAADCASCAQRGKDFFAAFGLPVTQLREYFDFARLEELKRFFQGLEFDALVAYEHKGTQLGREILPTICSRFRTSWKHINDPRYVPLFREYLAIGAMVFDIVTRLIEEWNPTGFVLFNGVGFTHTPAFLAAKRLNVPVLCHERGTSENAFRFSSNVTIEDSVGPVGLSEAWKDVPLDAAEFARTKDFFMNREVGRDINLPAFFQFSTDPRTVRSYLRIPNDAKIVSVFTSTEYEMVYEWKAYKDLPTQQAVLENLIEIFRGRSEYLVIRHHPNIAGGRGGAGPEIDMLTWQFDQARSLPSNVRIVMPVEKLNSYALLWNSDAVISTYSTVRVEAIARGIPTASFNHVLHRLGMTGVITSADPAHLSAVVDNLLGRTITVDDLRALYRTVAAYNFKNSVVFNSFGIKENYLPDIKITTLDQLRPGNDPALDRICDHLEHGASLLEQPTAAERARSESIEHELLAAELERVMDRRREFRSAAVPGGTADKKVLVLVITDLPEENIRRGYSQPRRIPIEVRVTLDGTAAMEIISASNAEFVVVTSDMMQFDPSWFDVAVSELEANPDKIGIRCQILKANVIVEAAKFPEIAMAATVFRRTALLEPHQEGEEQRVITDSFIRCAEF